MSESPDMLEREVAAAFAEVVAARPDDAAKLAAMIAAALEPPGGPPSSGGAAAAARPWPKLVGALGLAGVAAALLAMPASRPAPAREAVVIVATTTTTAPVPVLATASVERDDAEVTLVEPELIAAPDEPQERATPRLSRRQASPRAPVTGTIGDDPDELLRSANQARRARRFDDADRLYTDLQARFPGSRAARTSRVPHGRVLLDTLGRAADALDGFSAYLAADAGGTLAEEALVGRAQALQRLGREVEARAAWRDLLARFPDSAHAPAARGEIAEGSP